MANYKLSKTQRAKRAALKPIVDEWNRVHTDSWKIGYATYEDAETIMIYRNKPYEGFHDYIHGCLLTDIAGICNAYSWCWAIYSDSRYNGIYVNI